MSIGRKAGSRDAIEIAAIRNSGVDSFIESFCVEMLEGRYSPPPVRRGFIDKAPAKLRPLGISTIRDRVAQYAVVRVIEPIFEATFADDSYGFRPNRSAHDALRSLGRKISCGKVLVQKFTKPQYTVVYRN